MYQPIYRSIHRSILDGVSVDTRSSINRYIGRVSTDVSSDTPIGRYTWWLTETSPILDQYFTDIAPMLYLHRVYWLISVDISVDTLVDTPLVDKCLVSVDVSADTLVYTSVDTSVDSIKYWAIYRWIVSSITESIGR